jgi:hypothetical protein
MWWWQWFERKKRKQQRQRRRSVAGSFNVGSFKEINGGL